MQPSCLPDKKPKDAERIIIFACNDVYKLQNFGRLARFIQDTVQREKPVKYYVTMAGDFLAPSLLSSVDKGKLKIEIMNQVGFTHVGLGNHEFDLSVEVLVNRLKEMKFQVLNTNIHGLPDGPDGKPLTVPSLIETIPLFDATIGFKLGWLGFCTQDTSELCVNIPEVIRIGHVRKNLSHNVDRLKEESGCDFVLSFTHQDLKDDYRCIRKTDVDLILAGHDHEPTVEETKNRNGRDVWLTKVGKNLSHVGLVTIDVTKKKETTVKINRVEITADMPTVDSIEKLIKKGDDLVLHAHQRNLFPQPLCGAGGRGQDAELFQFILTRMALYNTTDIALMHGALFHGSTDYPDGLTIADLVQEFKYGQMIRVKLPIELLSPFVESYRNRGSKKFIQVDGGVRFFEETNQISHIAGQEIVPQRLYRVLVPVSLCVVLEDNQKYVCPQLVQYFSEHPEHISYDRKHQPPVLAKTITAALIAPDWSSLFDAISFEEIDTNHDGVLDKDELAAVVASQDVLEAVLSTGDLDDDGVISKAEWDSKMNPKSETID